LPKRHAQGFLTSCFFVQVSEYGHTNHDHCNSQGDEARWWREEGPVSSDVIPEQWEFSDYEEHCI
jgi:hypothetical protein